MGEIRSRFVIGDELHKLRRQVLGLREQLEEARRIESDGDGDVDVDVDAGSRKKRVREIERAIINAQGMDAEFVYQVSLERMESARDSGLHEEAERFKREAMAARSVLPQFNLDGLWVGKYGEHGYELINVTYVGNTLIAQKVTGEKNVPKGEVTFTVDLSPRTSSSSSSSSKSSSKSSSSSYRDHHSNNNNDYNNIMEEEEMMDLEPIELGESAAKQWGSKYLSRFAGKGQVSTEGFGSKQWMDGQLIIVKEYFSFAWLPISHQVFFGRPSAELTIKLLTQSQNKRKSASTDNLDHLYRCLEETDLLDDEMEVNDNTPFRSHNQHDYYNQEGCFE